MNKRYYALIIFFIIGVAVFLRSAFAIQFQVTLNDFWTVFYYARNMSLSEPASWQNSLFPVGYATVLGSFPVQHAIRLAFLLNIGLVSLFATSVAAQTFTDNTFVRPILSFLIAVSFPLVFRYGNTVGPDIGTAAWVAAGLFFLWHRHLSDNQPLPGLWQDILAGICLGLASLWRSHGAAISFSILGFYALLFGLQNFWERKWLWITFLVIGSVQGIVNLAAGYGFFESAQYLNLYKTFYGNDWYTFPSGSTNALFLELVISRPGNVIETLWPFYWSVAQYAWTGLALFFTAQSTNFRKYGLFVVLSIALYAGPVSFGSSPRAPLPALALSFSALAFFITELAVRIRQALTSRPSLWYVSLAVPILLIVAFLYQSAQTNIDFIERYNHQHETYASVERKLRENGLASPDQVFTSNFNFYLPYMAPHQPRFNGGWDVVIMYKFRQQYPELPVTSWYDFSQACREQGIRFLVLTPNSTDLADFLGEIYEEKTMPAELQKLGKRGNHLMLMLLEK